MWRLTGLIIILLIFVKAGNAQLKAEKYQGRVVLLAGKKSHGPGEHEYLKSLNLLKVMLDHSTNLQGLKTEVCTNGWPENDSTLDNADAIVVFADGSNFSEASDPLFTSNHLSVIRRQMARGCGLLLLHYSTYAPTKYAADFLNWVGGYYDYQNGPPDSTGKNTRYSLLKIQTALLTPENKEHPVLRGIIPFTINDEFYFNIRFGSNDPRLVPLITIPVTGFEKPQTIAWAVSRSDGGRGFAFTGCHFYKNWENENYRRLILNSIVWISGLRVPDGGVDCRLYTDREVNSILFK